MEIIKKPENCALCGLVVEIEGFALNTEQQRLPFCCAGCLSIYQLLNESNTEPFLTTQHYEES